MSNQLIPADEFQTVVPVFDGILTVQALSTSSPSNSNLLSAYQIYTISKATLNVIAQPLNTIPDLLAPYPTAIINPLLTPITPTYLVSDSDLIINSAFTTPLVTSLEPIVFTAVTSTSSLITPTQTIADIPPILYTTGTCFENLNSAALITTLEELYNYLCEVLIRFDGSPINYQQADYAHLIKTITNSLIYLYSKDNAVVEIENIVQFIGVATTDTNPLTDQVSLGHKFPGIYICSQFGIYTNFNITVNQTELVSAIVLFIPVIVNGIYSNYIKESIPIDLSLYTDTTLSGYGLALNQPPLSVNLSTDIGNILVKHLNGLYATIPKNIKEIPIGTIDGINNVFTTSQAFEASSIILWLNGLLEINFTVLNNTTIQLQDPPSINGFIDSLEIFYTILS